MTLQANHVELLNRNKLKTKIWIVLITLLVSLMNINIQAKSRIESYFPNRDVHLIEMLSSWAAGGGVHCHTNDQPAFSISK